MQEGYRPMSMIPRPEDHVEYLGDGVYIRKRTNFDVELYVSDGITESRPIVLEETVYNALRTYVRKHTNWERWRI